MNIFLGILAVILLLGMILESDEKSRYNFTTAFIAVIAAILIINIQLFKI